jgi:outer membrane protein assembly factor BamB
MFNMFKKLSLFVVSMLLLAGCAAAEPASPTATPTVPPTPTPQPGTGSVLWTFGTGDAIWSSPIVSSGVVYFGSDDMSLYAVDTTTHQLRWKFATGGVIRSRPAVADSMVYISSDDGVLHALEASSGTEKWNAAIGSANVRTGGKDDVGMGYDYQQSSPTVADGVVYVGSGAAEVDAFEAATGKQVWRFETASRVRSTPAISDGKVFVGDGSGLLHALDAKTGSELWNAQGCDIPSPAVSNGLVYCGSRGTLEVRAWDIQTGELRWQFSAGHSWVDSSPRVVDGTLYIGSSDAATLFALDPQTGELKWKFNLGGYAWCTPAVSQGVVYIGSFMPGVTGNFYAVDAQTGQQKWTLPVPYGVVSSPVVVDGVIYFGGMDGNLYVVQG